MVKVQFTVHETRNQVLWTEIRQTYRSTQVYILTYYRCSVGAGLYPYLLHVFSREQGYILTYFRCSVGSRVIS